MNHQIILLPGQIIKIKKKIDMYSVYLSIKSQAFCRNILISLNPSNGGIGIILKTASQRFIAINNHQKFMNASFISIHLDISSDIAFNVLIISIQYILEYIKATKVPTIAKAIFVAGPARATINSHCLGFL